jgi:hypothetical protein
MDLLEKFFLSLVQSNKMLDWGKLDSLLSSINSIFDNLDHHSYIKLLLQQAKTI